MRKFPRTFPSTAPDSPASHDRDNQHARAGDGYRCTPLTGKSYVRARIMHTTTIAVSSTQTVSRAPRAGEGSLPGAIATRSGRLFQLSGGWYFTTREKVTLGPFPVPEKAEVAVTDFLAFIRSAPPHVVNVFKRGRTPLAS